MYSFKKTKIRERKNNNKNVEAIKLNNEWTSICVFLKQVYEFYIHCVRMYIMYTIKK